MDQARTKKSESILQASEMGKPETPTCKSTQIDHYGKKYTSPCWVSYSLFLIMYPSLMNFLFPHNPSSTLTDIIRGPQECFWEMSLPRAVQSNFLRASHKRGCFLVSTDVPYDILVEQNYKAHLTSASLLFFLLPRYHLKYDI